MTSQADYSETLHLTWREYRPTDEAFVLSSWLRSYCVSPEMRALPHPVYFELYTPVVRRLVADSVVRVAHDAELPDTVIGFMVVAGDVLHYVFTKRRFRQLGVARWMLRDLPDATRYSMTPWHFGQRLIRSGWGHDPMARWPGRHPNHRTETEA